MDVDEIHFFIKTRMVKIAEQPSQVGINTSRQADSLTEPAVDVECRVFGTRFQMRGQ
jgi:hypothetical protein